MNLPSWADPANPENIFKVVTKPRKGEGSHIIGLRESYSSCVDLIDFLAEREDQTVVYQIWAEGPENRERFVSAKLLRDGKLTDLPDACLPADF